MTKSNIRNIAIIAHVDHGKTTLVDAFIKQSQNLTLNEESMNEDRIMDSNDLEKERGITIQAKSIAIPYKDHLINIIDTPGHADFGGEVERTLNMADGCVLLVDAQEGVMPQTKFVLKKALELGLKPIVCVNKIDKKLADAKNTLSKVQDLFLTLVEDLELLDFPTFYAVGRNGQVFLELPEEREDALGALEADTTPLLDCFIDYVPAPTGELDGAFQMQVNSIEYNPHFGRQLAGKIQRGSAKVGQSVVVVNADDPSMKVQGKIKALSQRLGLADVALETVSVGEIVIVTGIEDVNVGDTICAPDSPEALPTIKVSPPTLKVKFEANTSPFLGREGKFSGLKQLQNRLELERISNVSLDINKSDDGAYYVAGRGELHLAVFIETLRREGFEFQIQKPEVILSEIDGVIVEPVEEVFIEVPEEYQGVISTEMGSKQAEFLDMQIINTNAQYTYKMRTRDLLGLKRTLITLTKGNLVMHNHTVDHVKYVKDNDKMLQGRLISNATGKALAYSMNSLQDRGQFIIEPNVEIYEGMILGLTKDDKDIHVNACKAREKNNVRMARGEITLVNLKSTLELTIENAIGLLHDDEMLEVTPENIRMRKRYLNKQQQFEAEKKAKRKGKS